MFKVVFDMLKNLTWGKFSFTEKQTHKPSISFNLWKFFDLNLYSIY